MFRFGVRGGWIGRAPVDRLGAAFRCRSGLSSDQAVAASHGGNQLDSNRSNSSSHEKKKRRRMRLDNLLKEQYPDQTLKALQSYILQGKVIVNGHKIDKTGEQVPSDSEVELLAKFSKFVSRAGLKLEGALDHFNISVEGKCALDCGISTGGFTDCLLQRGASRVYGVDVGYGDVAYSIRQDPRVVLLERTNIRQVDPDVFDRPIDIVTLDVSFISVLKVLPTVFSVLQPQGELVVLIKPQFECRKDQVEDGGVVTDAKVHMEVIDKIVSGVQERGMRCVGYIESPIKGALAKNTEFLAYFNDASS
ncbi:hypothetical protein BSKO_03759 [Bryopsis sp. KO-2023]|nr:hypothetical protein BSKO_03759 [Bryopsis sp. KO-2023]